MSNQWKTGKREKISFKEICVILENVASSKKHKVIIGSDSVKLGYDFVFAKAICVLNSDYYDKRYFYFRSKIKNDLYLDLSNRLLKETTDSIELALEIKEMFKHINIEIHADVNPDKLHQSSRYKNMISGYIRGCGFDFKIKPESFVASSIADLHTRKA
jgi:predicted RNase H-related nuclease YkuK (DUF458 family)